MIASFIAWVVLTYSAANRIVWLIPVSAVAYFITLGLVAIDKGYTIWYGVFSFLSVFGMIVVFLMPEAKDTAKKV